MSYNNFNKEHLQVSIYILKYRPIAFYIWIVHHLSKGALDIFLIDMPGGNSYTQQYYNIYNILEGIIVTI